MNDDEIPNTDDRLCDVCDATASYCKEGALWLCPICMHLEVSHSPDALEVRASLLRLDAATTRDALEVRAAMDEIETMVTIAGWLRAVRDQPVPRGRR